MPIDGTTCEESGDGYQNNKFDEADWQINNQTCA